MLGVMGTAARLFVRHWPMLLTLAFLGCATRAGALWAAVVVSDHSSFLAQLLLILAPLGYLLPIIAMLHLLKDSLPRLREAAAVPAPIAPTEQRPRRLIDVAVSVLVPFLAVYVSYGLLTEDHARFVNQASFEEFNRFELGKDVQYDFGGRVGIYSWQIVLMIVVVAWVARWSLGRIERRWHFLGLAVAGALVEVYYSTQVARRAEGIQSGATQWLQDRRAAHFVVERYDDVVARLGPLADPADALTTWVGGLIGSLDAVIIVPLAWLTVGAVVLGHKLDATPPDTDNVDPHPVWARVPKPIRAGGGALLKDLRERWSAFWNGLKLLGSAGLIPMLAFCLVFLIALRIPWLVSHVWRLLAGPTLTDTWLAFSPLETGIGLALSMAVTAVLLAAALDWLLAPTLARRAVSEPAA